MRKSLGLVNPQFIHTVSKLTFLLVRTSSLSLPICTEPRLVSSVVFDVRRHIFSFFVKKITFSMFSIHALCLQCSIAGVQRKISPMAMTNCGTTKRYWFNCSYCNYRWTCERFNGLKKLFTQVYFLTLLRVAVRRRKARIAALCVFTLVIPLNDDVREKIIREAGLSEF